jgi:hypothetical protein
MERVFEASASVMVVVCAAAKTLAVVAPVLNGAVKVGEIEADVVALPDETVT